MPDDNDFAIEESPLSQKITRDGITVEVCIYRGEDDPQWILEVVDQEGASTVWDDRFPSDTEAWEAALLTIEREGINCFLNDPKASRH
jgi:hypothetical protein